jgi:protein TonB
VSSAPRPRIIDVVFDTDTPEPRWWIVFAALVTLAVHASIILWALRSERSLESWSASVAARVHAELGREQFVELTKPPPPPPQPPEQTPPAVPNAPAVHHPKQPLEPSKPPPPAQAGNIIAREAKPDAPVDLTGDTFVTGKASAYAGGVTTSTGTNPVAVQTRDVDPRSPPGQREPDRSSTVSLEETDWNCPFPHEADAEQIDEQTVLLRVVVQPDGTVESATILKDPGHGFGQQTIACAMRTRFTAAHDRQGRAIRSQSPPIRVWFKR